MTTFLEQEIDKLSFSDEDISPDYLTIKDRLQFAKLTFERTVPCKNLEEKIARAKEQKHLAVMEEKYELAMEKKRVAKVLLEHEKVHPPCVLECSICLDEIDSATIGGIAYSLCCGKSMCVPCWREHGHKLGNKCPSCRAAFPDMAQGVILTQKWADKGRSWAQVQIALSSIRGYDDYPIDKRKGVKYMKLAMEQNDPGALEYWAGYLYTSNDEVDGLIEVSRPKAIAMMRRSADMGNKDACSELAKWKNNDFLEGGNKKVLS